MKPRLFSLHLFILGAIKMYMLLSCNILSVPRAAVTRSSVLCFVWVILCFRPLPWSTWEYYMKFSSLVIQIYDFQLHQDSKLQHCKEQVRSCKKAVWLLSLLCITRLQNRPSFCCSSKRCSLCWRVAHKWQNSSLSPIEMQNTLVAKLGVYFLIYK